MTKSLNYVIGPIMGHWEQARGKNKQMKQNTVTFTTTNTEYSVTKGPCHLANEQI